MTTTQITPATKTRKWTATADGYRWLLGRSFNGIYRASAQQRCTTDTGAVYYRFVGPAAEFDTAEARARFVTAFTAKGWAE